MKTTHTPGPWSIDETTGINFRPIYLIESNGDAVCNTPKLADARLIAAAPELLEALKGLLSVVNVRIDDPRCRAFDFARAAILKALLP
jgi:hypothetical protein